MKFILRVNGIRVSGSPIINHSMFLTKYYKVLNP